MLPLTLKTIWLGQGHHSVSLSLPSASRHASPRILLCFLTRFCRRHRHPTLTRVGSYGAAMGKRENVCMFELMCVCVVHHKKAKQWKERKQGTAKQA